MSVIEFFTCYWDWYLLIGCIIASGYYIASLESSEKPEISMSLITLLIWPVALITTWKAGD